MKRGKEKTNLGSRVTIKPYQKDQAYLTTKDQVFAYLERATTIDLTPLIEQKQFGSERCVYLGTQEKVDLYNKYQKMIETIHQKTGVLLAHREILEYVIWFDNPKRKNK